MFFLTIVEISIQRNKNSMATKDNTTKIGIRLRAYPTKEQKIVLSQWMGASRVIWNAKCEEWKYQSSFAKKYMPIKTYAPIDASYAQYKDKGLTPYLFHVPAEVNKAAANLWRDCMRDWRNPKHPLARPARRKKKTDSGSVYLESRLFKFEKDVSTGQLRLYIGTDKHPVGYLKLKIPKRKFLLPKSIRIRKKAGIWWVSFCYEDQSSSGSAQLQDLFKHFKEKTKGELEACTVGVDRGIKVAAYACNRAFDYSKAEKDCRDDMALPD